MDVMTPAANRVARGGRALPDLALVLLIYAASRLFAAAVIQRTSDYQVPGYWAGDDPGYLGMAVAWDADWYRRIVEVGYPAEVPRGPDGAAQQNAWAFYPVYPLLVRLLMQLTGGSFPVVATLVSLLAGALATVVMFRLLDHVAGRRAALGAVALFCCFPAAPVLQIAYSESVALLLLVSALYAVVRRHYLVAIPLVVLVGFTRPIGLPLAGVVGVHLLVRWWRHRTGREALSVADLVSILVLGVVTFASGLAWSAVAWAVTGDSDAYTDTMGSWRAAGEVIPLRPWWDVSRLLLGDWLGPLLLVALVVAVFGVVLGTRAGRSVGPELQAWTLLYLTYLLVVLDPWTSLFRYLLLAFPVGVMAMVASRSRAYLVTMLAAFCAGQLIWVAWLLRFIPPTDFPP